MSNLELYQGNCLELMSDIVDKSIDCIICDLPFGTTKLEWDTIIDFDLLWSEYNRVLKDNANIVLFSSGDFTYKLYASNPKLYKYKLMKKFALN